jgi:hypothetical protein
LQRKKDAGLDMASISTSMRPASISAPPDMTRAAERQPLFNAPSWPVEGAVFQMDASHHSRASSTLSSQPSYLHGMRYSASVPTALSHRSLMSSTASSMMHHSVRSDRHHHAVAYNPSLAIPVHSSILGNQSYAVSAPLDSFGRHMRASDSVRLRSAQQPSTAIMTTSAMQSRVRIIDYVFDSEGKSICGILGARGTDCSAFHACLTAIHSDRRSI